MSAEEIARRFRYRAATPEQVQRMGRITEAAIAFAVLVTENAGPGRETSLAITNIEQAKFWANLQVMHNPVDAGAAAPVSKAKLTPHWSMWQRGQVVEVTGGPHRGYRSAVIAVHKADGVLLTMPEADGGDTVSEWVNPDLLALYTGDAPG